MFSLISASFALSDIYNIENNKVLQTCAYVSNSDTFFQKMFYRQEPSIKIHLPKIQGVSDNFEVYTLVMSGEDMSKVQIGLNPYYKVCDEYALSSGYCEHEPDEEHLKKLTLAELIDAKSFSHQIESFMLNTKSEEDHVYKLAQSSIYCIMFLSSTVPEDQESISVEVDWTQSFGNLLVSDFTRMVHSLYFAIPYFTLASYLLISIYFKIQKDKTSVSLDSLKYKKYTLQYKFIIFNFGTGFLYLVTMLNYLILNKYGYSTDSVVVPLSNLIMLALTTIINVWLIYNLMLFAAGAWFGGLKNSSLKLYVSRIIAIVLISEMLVFDMETSSIYSLIGGSPRDFLSIVIYIEFLLVYVLSLVWAVLTSFSIKERKLKNMFYITMILLTMNFGIVLFGAHVFSSTAQNAAIAYSIEFVFALIVSLLWNNVIIENNELVLKT